MEQDGEEGEGNKTMGDCLRDKVVPWKTHRRLVSLYVTVDICRSGVCVRGVRH
jgi:hypothetical protein